ncbi:MAG: FAD-dependent oxidoreductase [Patescibacteria group bacterium]
MNSQKFQQIKVVILGGGFAGIAATLSLYKELQCRKDVSIQLIDERNVHIYTPDLYEISTTFNEKITAECLTQLKDTVAIPFSKIIRDRQIDFLRDRVIRINPKNKTVELKNAGSIPFDYLIITLGSVVNYYDIPGLRERSYPLKTLTDALAINCHLDVFFQSQWRKKEQKPVSILVGGGGATGTEFACELSGDINQLCKKYHYPRNLVGITIIEAEKRLAGQDEKTTGIVLKRLMQRGIQTHLETFIREVTEKNVITETTRGKKGSMPMDILIWTGGVQPSPIIKESFIQVTKNGALPVNNFLQYRDYPSIFAAGDNATFIDSVSQKAAPMLAQVAAAQGKVLGEMWRQRFKKKQKKNTSSNSKALLFHSGASTRF